MKNNLKKSVVLAILAACGMLLTGCSNMKSENERQARIISDQKKINLELSSTNSFLKTRIEALEQELAEKDLQQTRDSNVDTLEQDFNRKMEALMGALRSELKDSMGPEDFDVISQKDRTIIRVNDQVLFASGKANLTKKGEEVMGKILAVLKEHKNGMVRVDGHTDTDPIKRSNYSSNWDLSCRRAVTVVEYLTKKGGLPGERLCAAGWGEFKPVNDKAKKADNRRVEIAILKNPAGTF